MREPIFFYFVSVHIEFWKNLKNFHVIFFFFYIISTSNSNHIKSQESKIPKIICEVINEVIKNSEISTVAILTGKRDFSINFQSELHNCLSRKILQFVINLTKIPNEVYLNDSTIYVLEAGLPKAWKLLHNDFMNYYVCSVLGYSLNRYEEARDILDLTQILPICVILLIGHTLAFLTLLCEIFYYDFVYCIKLKTSNEKSVPPPRLQHSLFYVIFITSIYLLKM